ncbi:MAG: hypothetical protein KDC66_07505 [Phaeodactylibacter sp.]|nr:hypothetical protein [Phaeodactylibacter sp.]
MPAKFQFEDLYGDAFVIDASATVTYEELDVEPPVPGEYDIWAGNLPIQTQLTLDQPFKFIVSWMQSGSLCPDLRDDAYWEIEVLMEKMGVEEFELAESDRKINVDYVQKDGHIYLEEITINKRKVPAGVYRPLVMINLRKPSDDPAKPDSHMPVAGFAELPPIQFYED